MQLQAIFVNNRKWFLDVFVKMLGSMNDAKVLQFIFNLPNSYLRNLFNEWTSHEGIKLYIIRDKGYPLLLWLMVHHKLIGAPHSLFDKLFNKQFNHAKVIIENSFGILKKIIQELLIKSNLDVHFLPNVVIYCYILHNMIMNGKGYDIDEFMIHLNVENVLKTRNNGRRIIDE